ncbi:DNA-binding transcriptional regulator DhaR [Escherichia coli]|uniref:DNA-binding transcriptional regulator DhaR n=1 Tax=Escherichia coli TaxID=562 RepID=A0A377KCY0_ECOLX|nr:DNA-binding transcriptional regulator DhaR [Escherichia coli]
MEKVFINCNRLVLGLENILWISDKITVVATMISLIFTSLAELEMQAIEHTCRVCEWNLTKAAEVLKIGRTTLWRKLKIYNLYPNVEHAD